ncbi:MAG: HesA/MoeB/ThiF family protein [Thermaurantiacus tibetensis]|uniref:HesA/MoeB/ThiF family protein n=1 Tax=Thermaurantiacus tibetensis TaxID=2759035 RepID=UPI00188F76C8|nr:molybdopterin-synthase adenylyltransferase MoeB [Thermaurantiacus tibetensis]
MTLSDLELERYARHIVLPEVGGAGQARLKAAAVAVVGAGGLGSAALPCLAAAGVGQLTIVDDDCVALSNLQRQTLYATADIGRPKAEVAAERLAALNPHVCILARAERLTEANAAALLAGHDLVLDGTDSFAARAVVNRACVALGLPLVAAAMGRFEGQLGVFAGHLADSPCWACFAGAAEDRPGETCAARGVLGALAGVMGSLQALEAIRLLTGFAARPPGELALFDALTLSLRRIRVPKDPACPVCSSS